MKHFKKRIVLLFLILIVLVVLTACDIRDASYYYNRLTSAGYEETTKWNYEELYGLSKVFDVQADWLVTGFAADGSLVVVAGFENSDDVDKAKKEIRDYFKLAGSEYDDYSLVSKGNVLFFGRDILCLYL